MRQEAVTTTNVEIVVQDEEISSDMTEEPKKRKPARKEVKKKIEPVKQMKLRPSRKELRVI